MRNVENGETRDSVGVKQCDAPGYRGSPIVSGEEDALLAELFSDGDDVRNEFGERVGAHAGRFAASVVTALVGDDDAEAGGGQRSDLFVPGVPEFREAVEENDGRAILEACGDGVKGYAAVLKGEGFQGSPQAGECSRTGVAE